MLEPFSDEQLRTAINLEQAYHGWMSVERRIEAMPYALTVRNINGGQYLVEKFNRRGDSKSHGRQEEEKMREVEDYRSDKEEAKQLASGMRAAVAEQAKVYRALSLPPLPSGAGRILRQADKLKMLDGTIMVVGTNALPAYALEAMAFIRDAPDETQDFDIAWVKQEPETDISPVWSMLKAVDSSYTINSERPFQALNRDAYEVEILAAPSRIGAMTRRDKPRPVPLPEQEWLLLGKPVDHVVACRDRTAARIVAPDPRYFALHKLWMSDQEKRNALKRPKDLRQGNALLNAIGAKMPHYKLDEEFGSALPPELHPYFNRWFEQWTPPDEPRW